jgi:hypothetical protein
LDSCEHLGFTFGGEVPPLSIIMKDDSIKLTREELYERVWVTPATRLAKEFGLSDVALGKLCRKMDVPKPYPGYWQQLAAGRRVHKEPLPPIKQGVPAATYFYPRHPVEPFRPGDGEVLARVAQEDDPVNKITVSETLHGAHSLVSQTRQVLEKDKPDDYGMLSWSWDQRCMNVRVSKTTLHRALRVMDALLKALEARGYGAEVSKDEQVATYILVSAERVKVRLWEKATRSERELTAEEKKKPSHAISNRWVYSPSGKLTFEIDEYCEGFQKKWADKAQKPLEEQLNEVLAGLILAGEALRLRRIEREDERRRQREQERQHMEDQERRHYLDQHLKSWSESQRLRGFLRACEESLVGEKGELATDSAESKWLRWAHRYADRIDPLKNGTFEEEIIRLIRKAEGT